MGGIWVQKGDGMKGGGVRCENGGALTINKSSEGQYELHVNEIHMQCEKTSIGKPTECAYHLDMACGTGLVMGRNLFDDVIVGWFVKLFWPNFHTHR